VTADDVVAALRRLLSGRDHTAPPLISAPAALQGTP
jgi:hypothetical protein